MLDEEPLPDKVAVCRVAVAATADKGQGVQGAAIVVGGEIENRPGVTKATPAGLGKASAVGVVSVAARRRPTQQA